MQQQKTDLYDAVIIGGGPAGLSAAIYLGRAKYRVIVLEKERFGGQITITSDIVNYPGVQHASGSALTENMRLQAQSFGAEFAIANVSDVDMDSDVKHVTTTDGTVYQTLGVVLALGANPRHLGFLGEPKFKGRGVAYCATCDGEFFTGKEVLVVGGGFAAVQESIFLTRYVKKVTMLVITENFTCARGVYEQLKNYPQIEVRFETELIEAGGDKTVEYAKIRDNRTGMVSEYRAQDGGNIGIFVFVGYAPATDMVKDKIVLNEQGYVVTDQNQRTNIAGVYAAGDVCIKNLRQVVTAVSDGAIAATSLEQYIAQTRERLNLGASKQTAQETQAAVEGGANAQGIAESSDSAAKDGFLTKEMRGQLVEVFEKFPNTVVIRAVVGQDTVSAELESFVNELVGIHEKVKTEIDDKTLQTGDAKPYVDICNEQGSIGIRYYSVPGGHEFNSFVVALYGASGAGKNSVGENTRQRIRGLQHKHLLQVMATLSCTNCPEVVMATQKLAAISDTIEAEMYDLSKFPELKEKYNIMAVPCLVIDEGKEVLFGKKGVEEIAGILENM